MRVLVTGVTGFVGRHLARALTADGHTVVGLSNETRTAGAAGAGSDPLDDTVERLLAVDVTDRTGLHAALDALKPARVVHLAGLSHVGSSFERPGDYLRVNFEGTRHLADWLAPRRVPWIFASSAEVYGLVPETEQPIAESRPLQPRSPYAMTKACAEPLARAAGAVVARSFNSIGPGQARRFALPSFAAQLAAIRAGRAEPVLRVGSLEPRRDFLHVGDAVDAYTLLLAEGQPGETFNIASGEALSIAEALERLLQVSGVEARIERDPARMRPVDVPLVRGDASRLHALGWRADRGLDLALEELWREALEREETTDSRNRETA